MNALILFVKDPVPGSVKTRLGATIGMEHATRLYRTFAATSFAIAADVAKRDMRVTIWYAPGANQEVIRDWVGNDAFTYAEQRGDSLGDRMQHAFRVAYRAGAEKAVIIGTDIPELTLPLVMSAFGLLDQHAVVIGPSTDGGYYLLGMKAPGIDIFEGVPWSTSGVLPATLRLIQKTNSTLATLVEMSDIDTEEDYRGLLLRQRK